ncbi:MAG: SDR family NAD(P)-dependent oxidoreductase [Hungatella hathewayi]|nr:SDR family NAD(P)-dependent oxidoreductase [Hungatella hathewayi]
MKIAVVTGASSGMGREAVIQIADRFGGIDEIWIIARRKERLKELDGHVPVTLRCFGLDVTDSDDLKVLEMALKENKPDVKLLINSAGYGKIGNVGDVCLEDETGMIQVNCQALCAVTHMVLPYMGKNSRILQFASSAAFLPQPRFAIYAATKSFVLSYSRALGAELKNRGIFVTAVCPGPVKTEFFDIAETTGHIPLYKRLVMADPRRVVRLALRDSMMGKPLSIYGFTMKGFYVLSKILPHRWLLYLMTHMKF